MIVNLLNINQNSQFLFKQKTHKNAHSNNISFGLNANNQLAISRLHQNSNDRISIIKSIDMEDQDIKPCLDEFLHIVSENPSNSEEMNVILDKLDSAHDKNEIQDCLSDFTKFWQKFFLSTRTKASEVMDSLKIEHPPVGHLSRTATNPLYEEVALRNIKNAQEYIVQNVERGICPGKELLINLHKIITVDLPLVTPDGKKYDSSYYSGVIRKSEYDDKSKNFKNQDCSERLDNFMSWLNRNYNKDDTFQLVAQSYKRLLGICPFYDANGRTIRSFIDALLYSKGYRLKKYPPNYAEVRSMKTEDLKKLYEENCEDLVFFN